VAKQGSITKREAVFSGGGSLAKDLHYKFKVQYGTLCNKTELMGTFRYVL